MCVKGEGNQMMSVEECSEYKLKNAEMTEVSEFEDNKEATVAGVRSMTGTVGETKQPSNGQARSHRV